MSDQCDSFSRSHDQGRQSVHSCVKHNLAFFLPNGFFSGVEREGPTVMGQVEEDKKLR